MNSESIRIEEKFQESKIIEGQLEFIEQQVQELKDLKSSVEDLKKSEQDEILTPIGKGAFIKSEIKEKNLFVEVGGEIIVKKSFDETLKVIESQLEKFGKVNFQLRTKIEEISSEVEKFLKESGQQ